MCQALHPTTVHLHRRGNGARESKHAVKVTQLTRGRAGSPPKSVSALTVRCTFKSFLLNNFLIMTSNV